jgi:hypothetical protein
MAVYDKSWQRIRWVPGDEDEEILRAVATYEVCYAGIEERATRASEDAIQLLKTFSFFYSTNIRFDILKRAVLNAVVEREAERRQTQVGSQRTSTWHEWYRDATVLARLYCAEQWPSGAAFVFTRRVRCRIQGTQSTVRAEGAHPIVLGNARQIKRYILNAHTQCTRWFIDGRGKDRG